MALQLYDKPSFFVKGGLLSEAESLSMDHKSNATPINTMQKGFAGVSPGAAMVEAKVSSAVPRVGFEFDAIKASQNLDIIEVVMFRAGKKVKTKGFITDVGEVYGTGTAAKVDFTMMCEPVSESTL